MDGDNATRFVASLVKSIQALCNGYIDFSTSIEVIGHIHLNIDRSVKLDYVLTEEVSKSVSEGATVFASHSYHSHPPSSVSSKNSNDSSKSSRQKQSVCVTQGSEADPLGFSSSVPLASSKSDSHSHARSSSHFVESSDSSHADNFVDSHDTESVKQEKSRTSFQVQESQERRRRSAPSHSQSQSHRTTSPAAKRIRHTDSNPEDFEVVEIKEEPDDEPAVFFGDSSSHMAAGQDLQTPDFSSVVMESLDRVGQVEGTKLVASGDGAQMQQPPFPVMMHSNTGMPSSSVSSAMPGPSLSDPQAQSLASTSGVGGRSKAAHLPSSLTSLLSSDPYPHVMGSSRAMAGQLEQSPGVGSPDHLHGSELQAASIPFHLPIFLQSKLKKQYSPQQMLAAMADVDSGKPVSKAAMAHGVPLRSLYRKLKNRNSNPTEVVQQPSGPVEIEDD